MKLYSRPGNDLTYRFTLIVESLARLRSRTCIIDGEAVCCDDKVLSIIHFGVDRNPPRCLGLPILCDLAALQSPCTLHISGLVRRSNKHAVIQPHHQRSAETRG